jgi:hypothetical protein
MQEAIKSYEKHGHSISKIEKARNKIQNMMRFLHIQEAIHRKDPNVEQNIRQLIKESLVEKIGVHPGDAFELLVTFYFNQKAFEECVQVMKDMAKSSIAVQEFVSIPMIKEIMKHSESRPNIHSEEIEEEI